MVLAFIKKFVDFVKEYLEKDPVGFMRIYSMIVNTKPLTEVITASGYRDLTRDLQRTLKISHDLECEYNRRIDEIFRTKGALPSREEYEEIQQEFRSKAFEMYKPVFDEIERKFKDIGVEIHFSNGCYYTNYDSPKSIEYCKKFGSDDVIARRYVVYACGIDDCLILQSKRYPDSFIIVYSRGNNTIVYNQLYGTKLFELVDEYLRGRGCEFDSNLTYTCKGMINFDELRAVMMFGLMVEEGDPFEMERAVQEIKIKEFESLLVR